VANALAEAVKRDACPLRRAFVERPEGAEGGAPTPLASLLRTRDLVGGKGGGLRISLLMTLIWVNAKPPYSTTRVAAYWAELLGMEDPRGDGARTVRDALHELADRGLIGLHSTGSRMEIFLLNEVEPIAPSGKPVLYEPPYGSEPYLPVPRSFWTGGLAADLSGAGIAMYLCALGMTRSDDPEFFISTSFFDERYGISRSSRKRGLAELTERGVLTVTVKEELDTNTFRRVRRNVYRLSKAYRQPAPYRAPEEEKKDAALAMLDKLLKESATKTRVKSKKAASKVQR
jgi:ribosomal protein S25